MPITPTRHWTRSASPLHEDLEALLKLLGVLQEFLLKLLGVLQEILDEALLEIPVSQK
jgi:hypothetical protein